MSHLVLAAPMVGHPVLGELAIEFVIAIVECDKSVSAVPCRVVLRRA